jgi:phosphoglucosamine mutase
MAVDEGRKQQRVHDSEGTGFGGPFVLRALGAEVVAIGCEPDGTNINAGVGSEHPAALAALVKSSAARLGIAHDGDGDRLVLCDETGATLDGDEVLTFLACHALERGTLAGGKLVVTVQSNLGVDAAVRSAGGTVVRCDVGDRYVTAAMARLGAVLGGESSGHLVFSRISPTGDGLVGAIEAIRVMIESGRPLSELRKRLVRFPQKTAAIRVRNKRPLEACDAIAAAIRDAEAALGERGRVLVRYSGTEPKIRLLVEGPGDAEVALWIDRLRDAVARDLETVRD